MSEISTNVSNDLFLGLDLSTQQLKGIIVNAQLEPVVQAKVEFDADFPQYKTVKGVLTNNNTREVQAPVAMWLEAVDLLLERIIKTGEANLSRLRGISGACQQHGSVYLNSTAQQQLADLDSSKSLKEQLESTLAWTLSPNWQDHSTEAECQQFDEAAGGKEQLALLTGSKAHHRFTGPQILKLRRTQKNVYDNSAHILLVSNYLASVIAGKIVSLDIADVCGMNLWDIKNKKWDENLLQLIDDVSVIKSKLGPVALDGSQSLSKVSPYFTNKYGISSECDVIPFTGDNPGTILALPLQPNDVIISLGTSTTALVVTENYVTSSMYHIFQHPLTNAYMGMLCYCNGALAREQVRDAINEKYHIADKTSWEKFNELALKVRPTGQDQTEIGFYFPLSEIIPDKHSTLKRLVWKEGSTSPTEVHVDESGWTVDHDALRILESQALSIRYRLSPMLTTKSGYPSKIYLVGGSSRNEAICRAMSRVLVPENGSFTLDLSDACAKGAANKAAFGVIGRGLTWDEFIQKMWLASNETEVAGTKGVHDQYSNVVELFVKSEGYI